MKFHVKRTSSWNNEKPCEEALLDKDNRWIVKINSMKELQNFIYKYGQIIIGDNVDEIEIYDDRRE